MTSYADSDVETDDEGETILDSTTGSLVLTVTGSGSKGGTGMGAGDRCADEVGREWKGIMGGGLCRDTPGQGGIGGGGAVCTGNP